MLDDEDSYDDVGYTLFLDVPEPKIRLLLSAPLQKIHTADPLDVTTVLQMFVLYSHAKEKENTQKILERLIHPILLSHLRQI